MHQRSVNEVLVSPASFMRGVMREQRNKRVDQLEKLGVEPMVSKRGWYGFRMPDCTWDENYNNSSVLRANWTDWPDQLPKGTIIQVKDKHMSNTCMLRDRAIDYINEKDWAELLETLDKLSDYSLLTDETHSYVEMEMQDEAWNQYAREEFIDELKKAFTKDDFAALGEEWEKNYNNFLRMLKDRSAVDSFFHTICHDKEPGHGEVWTESNHGLELRTDVVIEVIDLVFDIIPFADQAKDLQQLQLPFDEAVLSSVNGLANHIVTQLLEDAGPHNYSCIMINLPEELAEQIRSWGETQIKDTDLYVDKDGGCGREEEIHVTVKYGLSAPKPDDRLLEVFKRTAPFDIQLMPISLFRNDDFDVVKLAVTSPFLRAFNRNVTAVADCPGDKYPEYNPHVTLAYVKKGTCDRLEGTSPFESHQKFGVSTIEKDGVFNAQEIVFSSLEGTKKTYTLGPTKKAA